ncbi:MAG: serine/threonine protein kinase [Planctomycetota bacterium]|jgi:serine/threonine-protein kinase
MSTCINCGHQPEDNVKFCPSCGTQMGPQAEQADTLLGQTLSGKYRIISELGSGSMGTVYLGEHLGLKKKVALKILHPDLHVSDESLKRFQREGIAAGSFNHPNAIQIFDFDRAEGKHIYLALEFCEGQNLKVYLGESGPLSPMVAVRLIRQVLSTLAEAHAQGIVHRDLKPDNIMVVESAAGELTVKVLDFGLSKLVDRPLEASLQTQTGRIMGTPLYMSPEQWAGGDVDGRSDLYSAGLILYEMLSCHHPFRGSTITETMVKSTSQQAPSLAEARPDLKIPEGLEKVLDRSMQKRKADRYQSATQMII